jgi:acetyl-CoA C-acetyltransferase
VIFRPKGEIEHGVVMLRTEQNTRALARIPAQDDTTLKRLTDLDRTPVGSFGEITMAEDGVPQWRVV